MREKINFVVTLKTGDKVDITYAPDFHNHLEFRGKISETGYRSEFAFPTDAHPSLDEVKELAAEMAQKLYENNPAKYGTTPALI